jgi:hypothetical protein
MSAKLTLKTCTEIAKSNGGVCLSKKYIGAHSKLKWKCKEGHVWEAPLHSVKNHNHWCQECAKKRVADFHRLDGVKEAIVIAESRGGECLSREYTNNRTKILWKCEFGHVWRAAFINIKTQGQWCPKCGKESASKKQKLNGIDVVSRIAEKNGGRCLSKKYKNNKQKLSLECKNGHRWTASLNNLVSKKSWCPECVIFKTQKMLTEVVKKIFPNKKIFGNYKNFNWLKTRSGKRQELDIYVPEIKLAIEYDGEQHFNPVRFGGISEKQAKENLKNVRRLDALKDKKIKQNKNDIVYFVRFNYKEEITYDYVKEKIIKCGIKL